MGQIIELNWIKQNSRIVKKKVNEKLNNMPKRKLIFSGLIGISLDSAG